MSDSRDAVSVFKALGDESRLAIIRMLLEGESYVELIASRLQLTSATVSHHLKKLEEAGLVQCHRTQFYRIYAVRREWLEESLLSLIGTLPVPDDDTRYRREVIDTFFAYGTLKALPAQRKKREIVLAHILDQLEDRESYTEKEINEHILRFFEDYCTVRREMIAFGMLNRTHENGGEEYRKTSASL